jgi:hypothetical protein
MDLKGAIEAIGGLAVGAKMPGFVQDPSGVKGRYYICEPGKEPRLVWGEPGARRIECDSITGVCEAVLKLDQVNVGDEPFVYVGRKGVTVHLDEVGSRRNTVTMPFTKTDQMLAIEALAAAPIDQPTLVWMLRTTLAGHCLHPQFATMVRKLKITSSEDGQRSIAVGRESIGASVVREMSGIDGDLPETVEFSVPVYEEVWHDTRAGVRHSETVELAVHVSLEERAFVFKPTGSSIKDAQLNARRAAVVQFREKLGVDASVIEEATPV